MKICKKCHLEKPFTDFFKKKSSKDGYQPKCKLCDKAANKKYYQDNKDRLLEQNKQYYEQNRESIGDKRKLWLETKLTDDPDYQNRCNRKSYDKHKAFRLETYKKYYWDNLERAKVWNREYRLNNRGKVSAKHATRRAKLLQAMPRWANKKAIEEFYREAKRVTEETGIVHHVDHILSLDNDFVCGLHVEFNLRVITAEENLRKGNRINRELLKELGYHVE